MGRKQLAPRSNFTYWNINDVLSINNPDIANYLDQTYPVEFQIKDTTESNTSTTLLLLIGKEIHLHTSNSDKRDAFNFHITNFPFQSSNIPSLSAYGVFISQLYDIPGLVPDMNVLFWGPIDFQISYSSKDRSWHPRSRHSGSFMVDTGILFNNMKCPSREC